MKNALLLLSLFLFPAGIFAQSTVNINTTNVSCNSTCDGTATAVVTGGTPPYTYLWAPANYTTQAMTGLCAGNYSVIVTDAMGGTATASCVITQPTPLTTGLMPPSGAICVGTNVTISAMPSGGVAPYTCFWSPNTYVTNINGCSMTCQPLNSLTYTITVTDAVGCVAYDIITLMVSPNPTLTITQVPATCNQSNGTLTGSGAVAYSWMPVSLTGSTIINQAAGTYTCIGMDANGCYDTTTVVLGDSCDYVWPGDANDDAIADNIDILSIGIANGATGTTRANATTTWIGQPSAVWGTQLANGTDYKWVDCDGDGTIAMTDTQAVTLNYGMTHSNRYIAPTYSATAPDLSISFDQDSVGGGQTGTLTLALGDANTSAIAVYGIAFRLNYDAAQISTSSIGLAGGSSWFGTPGSDMMRVVLHPNAAMGYVDVAIARIDHQNMSGGGTIGQIYFTATTALNGTGNTQEVPMTLSNVVLINNAEVTQSVNAVNDSVVIADPALLTTVASQESTNIAVYPNPANDNISITLPGTEQQLVTIEDVTGRIVYSNYHKAGVSTIPVASLPAGAYVLRVTANNGTSVTSKIAIAH